MRRRLLVSFLVAFLLVVPFVSLVHGTYTNWFSNLNKQAVDTSNWLMTVTANNTVGQEVAGNAEWLYSARFYIQPVAAMTGTLYCGLWEYDETDWHLIENASNTFDCSTLSGWGWANFSFAGTTYLNSTKDYVVGIYFLVAPSQQIRVGDYSGTGFRYIAGGVNLQPVASWSSDSLMCTAVFVTSTVYGGGSGDDSWTPPPASTDDTITGIMWWFLYLVVLLAPAYFLGVFCKMGKWGFVLGLGIGAGIGYAFLAGFPLWLLILVAVGEAGLVYSTVSHEG